MLSLGLSLVLILFGPGPGPGPGPGDGDWELLAAPDGRARSAALERLAEAGPASARRALEGFAAEPRLARLSRSELIRRVGDADLLEEVTRLLADPEVEVRRSLVGFLARGDLGTRAAAERVRALELLAREDVDASLRARALEALGSLHHPASQQSLIGLLTSLPADEAPGAARALAGLPGARAELLELVQGAFSAGEAATAPRGEALAQLVFAYGRHLADLPAGGRLPSERVPFVRGASHPSLAVRRAAFLGLESMLSRLRVRGEVERTRELLAALAVEGRSPAEMAYRTCVLELTQGDDPARALEPARRLVARHAGAARREAREWRFYGYYFEAAARLAMGEPGAAFAPLERSIEVLGGLRRERLDLRPDHVEPAKASVRIAVDYDQLLAQVALLRSVLLLAEGREPGDEAVLASLVETHGLALFAQLRDLSRDAGRTTDTLDALLDRDIGPRLLVFGNERNPHWSRRRSLDLLESLGEALASVAAEEMPGFRAGEGSERPLLADPGRRALLEEIRLADREAKERAMSKLLRTRPAGFEDRYRRLLFQVGRITDAVENDDAEELFTRREASELALVLSREWRAEGEAERARVLAERLLEDLEARGASLTDPSFLAMVEMAHGSALTEAEEPEEAEAMLLQALDRLEALEGRWNELIEGALRAGGEADAASLRRALAATRNQRADVLVSLAVNANVRLEQPERALAFFEEAHALRQDDFMTVLLACYRARSGRHEEALQKVREVALSPLLYYNLACTYALVGESDLALDFLQRELEENHPGPGSRARQKAWAAKDPDLASLRELPRFQALVAE